MKAIVKKTPGKGFVLANLDEPKISNNNDVKIKMIYSSICGTDVHIYEWDDWANKNIKTPHINGHEGVGQVVEIGNGVTSVQVGDYVAYETHYYCKNCNVCKRQNYHVCEQMTILGVDIDGVWRETAVVPERLLFKIPSDSNIPIRYCGILEPFGNAYHTLSYTNLKDKIVLIQGDGPIGIFAALIAKAKDAKKIILSGWGESIRQQIAKDCNITFVDRKGFKNNSEYKAHIKKLTNNESVEFIGEFTGNPSALQEAVEIITPGGQISVLSIFSKNQFELDINSLVIKNISMQFICGRKIFETWTQSFQLINSGKIDLKNIDKVITHQFDLVDFEKGFQEILAGKAGKVILNINPELDKNYRKRDEKYE